DKATYRIIKKADLPHTKIELRDDGIIQFFYGDDVHYNMEISQEVENEMMAVTEGVTYMSLRVAGKKSSMAIKVMQYLSRGRGCLLTLADAFVIKSLFQRILAKIYMSLAKPYVPTKFFENVEEAETWVKSLNKNELKEIHKLNLNRVY
ncbi:MAG TPA: hypothetical protein VN698_13270, partial [Bacteroidia bacterium]|nr:hypothetical protein [Bacteroidia bacterium]